MFDLAEPADVAVDFNVIRRISEHQLRWGAVEQSREGFGIGGIAAD